MTVHKSTHDVQKRENAIFRSANGHCVGHRHPDVVFFSLFFVVFALVRSLNDGRASLVRFWHAIWMQFSRFVFQSRRFHIVEFVMSICDATTEKTISVFCLHLFVANFVLVVFVHSIRFQPKANSEYLNCELQAHRDRTERGEYATNDFYFSLWMQKKWWKLSSVLCNAK